MVHHSVGLLLVRILALKFNIDRVFKENWFIYHLAYKKEDELRRILGLQSEKIKI